MKLETIRKIFEYQIWQNDLGNILIACAVFLILYYFLPLIRNQIVKRLSIIAKRTVNTIDDLLISILGNISKLFFFAFAVLLASQLLYIPTLIETWLRFTIYGIIIYEIAKGINTLVQYAILEITEKNHEGEGPISFLGTLIKIAVWMIAVLMLLQNIGVNVTSLVAGLGIGGIAIALALQSILGDMFSSFSIFLDQPFQTGDFIVVGETMGTVKKIGVKTTRLESLTGEELIIPNTDLTGSKIHNYKRMQKRRSDFIISVEYSTDLTKLKRIPDIIHKIGKVIDDCKIDRVHFKEFGNSALNFEVVFWVFSSDYNYYCQIQQKMNLAIFEAFQKEKINFAFPTQTLLIEKLKTINA